MKKIGETVDGNVILEATHNEYRMLLALQDVADGKAYVWVDEHHHNPLDDEFADTFRAIADWVNIANHANSLRGLANNIDFAIKRKTEEAAK